MKIVSSKDEFHKEWLLKNSQWFRDRLWQVLVELKAEQELTGSDIINIPLERFKKKNIDLEETKKLLINLDKRKIISIAKIIRSNQDKSFFVEQPIIDDENLFYDPKTKITLSHEFEYLYSALNKLQHPGMSLAETAKRFLKEREEKDKALKLKKVDELEKRLSILEQEKNAKKVTPKNRVKEILKEYKFPKQQKKLIKELAGSLQKNTNHLKEKLGGDVVSTKNAQLPQLKNLG